MRSLIFRGRMVMALTLFSSVAFLLPSILPLGERPLRLDHGKSVSALLTAYPSVTGELNAIKFLRENFPGAHYIVEPTRKKGELILLSAWALPGRVCEATSKVLEHDLRSSRPVGYQMIEFLSEDGTYTSRVISDSRSVAFVVAPRESELLIVDVRYLHEAPASCRHE